MNVENRDNSKGRCKKEFIRACSKKGWIDDDDRALFSEDEWEQMKLNVREYNAKKMPLRYCYGIDRKWFRATAEEYERYPGAKLMMKNNGKGYTQKELTERWKNEQGRR